MPALLVWLLGGGAFAMGAGFLIDKTGEAAHDTGAGVNEAATGTMKLIITAAVAFYVLKKAKVI